MGSVEEAKDFLQGTGLYDHLTELLLTVLEEQPADAVDGFEALSISTKAAPGLAKDVPVHSKTAVQAQKVVELISGPPRPPPAEGEEEEAPYEEPEKHTPESVADFVGASKLLGKAGVGFGDSENYRVALAVKKLGENMEFALSSVKFWGKIIGTKADYLVCECIPGAPNEAAETDPAVVPADAPGTGCNKYVYYVCNSPGDPWVALPDAKPECIMAARSIKKLFTGDLAAKIEGYPVFPGSEADYLRAQVARITADTCIAPAGVYALEDGYEAPGADAENDDRAADPPIAPVEEEYTPPSALTVLTDASGWVHSERQLLKTQGKCGWYKFPEPEEEEVEEGEEPKPKPAPQVPEAAPAALASLSDDAAAADKVPAWSFRASLAGFGGSAVAVAKSLKWPGAVTVGMLAGAAPPTCANVYVGTGAVYEGAPFSPPLPPSVAEEAEDPMEQTDPTAEEEAAANAPAEEEGAEEE